MPELKQPPLLLKMATNRLVDFLAKRCDECSINGSLDELRQVVAFIKEDIGPIIPRLMRADFFESFLFKYSHGFKPREERPERHKRAVLEVIMDRKIDDLHLRVSYLPESMDLKDTHRIRGLNTLNLSGSRLLNLETFHLEDLKKFICVGDRCTDAELEIIGKNCPKLEHLSIERSKQVTDKGLVALNKCTELRIADFRNCPKITARGIQEFLEAHEKIENIPFDFKCFSDEGWSVYPSVTHYAVYLEKITNNRLRLVAKKFPNLTSLNITGWLNHPRCLSKSTLKLIGANVTGLYASGPGFGAGATPTSLIRQADLDAFYECCPNIESLHFHYQAEEVGQILVIPPFGRLRTLGCSIYSNNPHHISQLQFGVMANLKTLRIENVETTTEMLESLVLDNDKFPVLNCIFIRGVSSGCDLDRIREIVKNNNIDLCIY